MWITSGKFIELADARAKAEGRAEALERQVAALQGTIDWMSVRLNQLEHERAVMVENYMGIKLKIPVLQPAPESETTQILQETVDFRDVGDVEAKRLGLAWNERGELVFSK